MGDENGQMPKSSFGSSFAMSQGDKPKEAPAGFKQHIPDGKYLNRKRMSVFNKVDISAINEMEIPNHPKTPEQMAELMPLLMSSFLTKNLSPEVVTKVAGATTMETFKIGDEIITYGDDGKAYFILARGRVKVIVYQPKTDPQDPKLADKIMFEKTMEKGVGFGELALIYNDKRSATIRALEECRVYALDGVLFKKIIIKSSMQKRSQNAGFLNSIKLFDSLDKQQKLKLVDGL